MDALLMCGGRGTRLDSDIEKPLFEVGGRPMVERVVDALDRSCIETTYAVGSPQAPATHEHLAGELPVIETAGEGYVPDLLTALESVETPVLTVAADLPLLDASVVDHVVANADGSTSVRVPLALKELLGVSVDGEQRAESDSEATDSNAAATEFDWVATGVNVVGDEADSVFRSYDARLAVNVNRRSDAAVAERLLAEDARDSASTTGRWESGP